MGVNFKNEMTRVATERVDAARASVREWKVRFKEADGRHQMQPNYPDEFKRFSNAVEELRLAEQASEYLAKMTLTGS